MKFFNDCKTHEEAKTTFRKLAKCFHPDKGGDFTLMVELRNQYDQFTPDQSQNYTFNTFGSTYPKMYYENEVIMLRTKVTNLEESLKIEKSWRTQYQLDSSREIHHKNQEMNMLKREIGRVEDKNEELRNKISELKKQILELQKKKTFFQRLLGK